MISFLFTSPSCLRSRAHACDEYYYLCLNGTGSNGHHSPFPLAPSLHISHALSTAWWVLYLFIICSICIKLGYLLTAQMTSIKIINDLKKFLFNHFVCLIGLTRRKLLATWENARVEETQCRIIFSVISFSVIAMRTHAIHESTAFIKQRCSFRASRCPTSTIGAQHIHAHSHTFIQAMPHSTSLNGRKSNE